jgi:hypothetical protein
MRRNPALIIGGNNRSVLAFAVGVAVRVHRTNKIMFFNHGEIGWEQLYF